MDRGPDPMRNFHTLRRSAYPGRGIIMGIHEDGRHLLQLNFLMSRHEHNRNRVFEHDGDTLKTTPADPAKLKDPSYLIYTAMCRWGGHYIVGNGDHTSLVLNALRGGRTMKEALVECEYEKDENGTPRITGVYSVQSGTMQFGIIRRRPSDGSSVRDYYSYIGIPGVGRCITTYDGDGDPCPSFKGVPYVLPLRGSPEHILDCYWDALDRDNRVAIALRHIEIATGHSEIDVKNRHEKVLA